MADALLLENGTDRYLLEDGTGVYLLDSITTIGLSDNFDDNSTDAALWSKTGTSANVNETSGQLQVTISSGATAYSGYQAVSTYNLTGSAMYGNVVNAGNQALASLQVLFKFYLDATNSITFVIANNNLLAQKQVANVTSTIATTSYNSSIHAWLQLREYSGNTIWEFSSTGLPDSWTNFISIANPFALTAITPQLVVGTYAAESTGTTAAFDNFNTLPVSTTATGQFFLFN